MPPAARAASVRLKLEIFRRHDVRQGTEFGAGHISVSNICAYNYNIDIAMAEVLVPKALFEQILARIARLTPPCDTG